MGEVIGWKFNHAPGIRTREKPDGTMEIFDWPAALGPQPTPAQIAQWTMDFKARPVEKATMDAEDIWRVLRTKGIVTDTEVPLTRRVPQ